MDPRQERSVTLLLSHRAMLLGYIVAIVRDSDLAEDVFQNVALVVLDKAGAIARDEDFPAWVRRVARFESLAALRKRRRAPELLDPSMLELLEDHWSATDPAAAPARKALRECVEALSPYARRLIQMRYVDGLSGQEVADRLNRSLNTVYVALSRTYRHLADCVERRLAREERDMADEAFAVQVLRYLDGQATVQDLSELKEALATRPRCRALFVRLCRLHGELGELLAPMRAAVPETAAAPHPARADASPGVSGTEPAGGPDRLPNGDPPETARPSEETVDYVEDGGDDTTH